MVDFPKYESYKDSGVEWLGEIPSHWDFKSIRAVTELKSERNRPDLPVLSVYREYGILLKDSRDDNHNATSLDISNYKVVKVGDLVVNKMKAWQGSMGVSEHEGIVSPAYIICRVDSDKVEPKFLHYLLRSKLYIGIYNALSYGVRVGQWDMHYEDFKKIPLFLPSVEEQKRIVEFIERKTSEIDQAIVQKHRLIELLQEQKAILINQAVSKGLDPNVPMCDSRIEWIGEIPAHWSLMRFKHITSLLRDGTHLPPPRTERGFRLLSVRNIVGDEFIFREDDSFISETHFKKLCKSFQPTKGDVLLAIVGATLGKVAIVPDIEPFYIQRSLAIFRPNEIVSSEYLKLWIQSSNIQNLLWNTTEFSAQPGIYLNSLKEFPIVLPSYKEQEKIVTKLFTQFEDVDRASQKNQSEIATLEELKQVFIAEAVTGKIKV